ncbi:MAG: DUF4143 domain-containing protein [Methanomassiliicoccaceae archaeon]|nr:DUF4143 domain-containing protein [Methanomassiliicoccaceae archaeon]
MVMRPMSLFESLESSGEVSLESLFDGKGIRGTSSLSLDRLAFALVRGGWPASVRDDDKTALRHARSYVKTITKKNISEDGKERNSELTERIMRSIARNISTAAKNKTILDDVSGNNGDHSVSDKTYADYVDALTRLYVIEDLPAWSPYIRSRVTLMTSPKRHFTDPSIAAVLLRTSPGELMKDFKTFGLLFESLCIRDLRVYAQSIEGEVYYYRDGSDLEVDAIIHMYDGRWGAVEIKMGWSEIEKAAENLKKLRDKIDLNEMKEPSFLLILTTGGFAFRREDGIYVVPIECLKN